MNPHLLLTLCINEVTAVVLKAAALHLNFVRNSTDLHVSAFLPERQRGTPRSPRGRALLLLLLLFLVDTSLPHVPCELEIELLDAPAPLLYCRSR